MSVLENNVKAKIVETKTTEASITIKKIVSMVSKHWEKCLDNYYIMDEEPSISTDEYQDSVTVSINDYSSVKINDIADDVAILFEEELETYIKEQEVLDKMPREEGENGSL